MENIESKKEDLRIMSKAEQIERLAWKYAHTKNYGLKLKCLQEICKLEGYWKYTHKV